MFINFLDFFLKKLEFFFKKFFKILVFLGNIPNYLFLTIFIIFLSIWLFMLYNKYNK
ncbi:hypothetical protein [Candidatus Shikimatogenerans silvanidophilus]|uniref:hypothetical protein n=1 Tax=Candidatus Shikimatogenerans silvanidophilus TaxID=2782547 RepID=UPI001BAE1AB6|nr:hypothetical protein [Candidatus Shikimatogenerans silvanidophilus]